MFISICSHRQNERTFHKDATEREERVCLTEMSFFVSTAQRNVDEYFFLLVTDIVKEGENDESSVKLLNTYFNGMKKSYRS